MEEAAAAPEANQSHPVDVDGKNNIDTSTMDSSGSGGGATIKEETANSGQQIQRGGPMKISSQSDIPVRKHNSILEDEKPSKPDPARSSTAERDAAEIKINDRPISASSAPQNQNHSAISSSSLPMPPSSSSSSTSLLNEERIEKAEAFLRNTEIGDVPTSDKRRYLESKVGLTSDEFDAAMERVVADKAMMIGAKPKNNDDGLNKYGITSQSRQREDQRRVPNGQQLFDRGGGNHRRQNPNQYDRDNRDPSRNGDPRQSGLMPERRPPPQQQQYGQQQYGDSNNNNNNNNMQQQQQPYNNNVNSTQGGYGMNRGEEPLPPPSASFFPAWAGGFSLGVLCLAALRWLNGGDFVLIPPPTAQGSLVTDDANPFVGSKNAEEEQARLKGEEDDTDESVSQQQEEDEDLQVGEYEEYEEESNEEDDNLQMLLNGTANTQKSHPENTQPQPSYDELILEIRALTTAIHSFRDVQERANRAVTAKVGKGMTDDAMDFLRRKKTEEVVAVPSSQAGDEEVKESISSVLAEVSGDLTQLKQSILQNDKEGKQSADDLAGDSDIADEPGKGDQDEKSDESKGESDGDNDPSKDRKEEVEDEPSKQIEKVMGKIQKVLDIVEKEEESEKKTNESSNERENAEDAGVDNEDKSTSTDLTTVSAPSQDEQTEEKSHQNENAPSEIPIKESALTNEQLEEALRTLANSNSTEDLKVGAQMLYLYCLNISKNPSVPRYRKIYTNNNTFRNKVGTLVGVKEFLAAVGFEERGANLFEWAQADDAPTKSRLDFALVALEMMKNGTKPKDNALPAASESDTIAVEALGLPLSAALSVSGVAKGIELN